MSDGISGDEWEDQMIKRILEMFKGMGMPIDEDTLRNMMKQFKEQIESAGIDPSKLSGKGVNFNIDMSQIQDMLSGGGDIEDMLKKMGVQVKVDAKPVEIETPDEDSEDVIVKDLEPADYYLNGWTMNVTLDCSMEVELDETNIEITLLNEGNQIEVMRSTQTAPVARVPLPHQCEELVEWTYNNGILDLTLKLVPQGSAVDESKAEPADTSLFFDDDEDEDDDDEFAIEIPDVTLDLGDDDDDDDGDGGIPLF